MILFAETDQIANSTKPKTRILTGGKRHFNLSLCVQMSVAEHDDGLLEREIELDDGGVLYVADGLSLQDEAGATTWDCGLVLAHYLIKQHEMGGVGCTGLRSFSTSSSCARCLQCTLTAKQLTGSCTLALHRPEQ